MANLIMIVEDEEALAVLLKYNLETEGFQVITESRGSRAIAEIEKTVGIDLSEIDCETFAGFIFSLLDEIPLNKKNIKLNYQNIIIKQIKSTGHKIEQALLQRIKD